MELDPPPLPPPTRHRFTLSGLEVKFLPGRTPYAIQRQIMLKLIAAMDHGDNALLSAPTGSGKTAALLTAVLAWQDAVRHHDRPLHDTTATHKKDEEAGLRMGPPPAIREDRGGGEDGTWSSAPSSPGGFVAPDSVVPSPTGPSPGEGPSNSPHPPYAPYASRTPQLPHATPKMPKSTKTREVPQLIYVTRTHSQVSQVMRELKRLAYDPSAIVLASRKQYCIHPNVRDLPHRDAACKKLLQDAWSGPHSGCKFHQHDGPALLAQKVGSDLVDVEDLAQLGRQYQACPYFAARHLARDANVVIAPYNYLFDPTIRAATGLDVQDAVVVIDEAHNVEDVCREQGSFRVSLRGLRRVATALDKITTYAQGGSGVASLPLTRAFRDLATYLETKAKNHVADAEGVRWSWGPGLGGLIEDLETMGLGEDTLRDHVETVEGLVSSLVGNDDRKDQEGGDTGAGRKRKPRRRRGSGKSGGDTGGTVAVAGDKGDAEDLEIALRLLRTLELVHNRADDASDHDLWEISPYRTKDPKQPQPQPQAPGGGGDRPTVGTAPVPPREDPSLDHHRCRRSIRGRSGGLAPPSHRDHYAASIHDHFQERGSNHQEIKEPTLSLWCLRPGVTFSPLARAARTVILASGTLAPMDSLAAELQTSFPLVLDGQHVVPADHVATFVVPRGLANEGFLWTYANTQDVRRQDACWTTVMRLTSTVPPGAGVLVLFPSYRLLESVVARGRILTGIAISSRRGKSGGGLLVVPIPGLEVEEKATTTAKTNLTTCTSAAATAAATATSPVVVSGTDTAPATAADPEVDPAAVPTIPTTSTTPTTPMTATVVVESRDQDTDTILHQMRRAQSAGGRTVLFAVCRGKLSEGVDLADHECRLVVTVGIPYLAAKAPEVTAKKRYNSSATGVRDHLPSGDDWYALQAFRALNQGVGRCIRHRRDYGAVVLLDERFGRDELRQRISRWVLRSLHGEMVGGEEAAGRLKMFYTHHVRAAAAAAAAAAEPLSPAAPTRAQRVEEHLRRLGIVRGVEGLVEALGEEVELDLLPGVDWDLGTTF